jgi:hypothetical protein
VPLRFPSPPPVGWTRAGRERLEALGVPGEPCGGPQLLSSGGGRSWSCCGWRWSYCATPPVPRVRAGVAKRARAPERIGGRGWGPWGDNRMWLPEGRGTCVAHSHPLPTTHFRKGPQRPATLGTSEGKGDWGAAQWLGLVRTCQALLSSPPKYKSRKVQVVGCAGGWVWVWVCPSSLGTLCLPLQEALGQCSAMELDPWGI